MSNSNITLRQWITKFNNGDFQSSNIHVQCSAGWYDWFCKDESLVRKTYSLAPKVKKISNSTKVNQDTMYVFFKNNCPLYGKTYDDFRICDIESGNVIYTICPKNGHKGSGGVAELWGKENNFETELVVGTMKDIYNYFGV